MRALASRFAALPPLHNDPFNRILAAQAGIESLTLVSYAPAVRAYGGLSFLPS
jgi:PIN domain nuclease of toxin-antitoxin system